MKLFEFVFHRTRAKANCPVHILLHSISDLFDAGRSLHKACLEFQPTGFFHDRPQHNVKKFWICAACLLSMASK